MTALDQARAAYGASARVMRTARDMEYDVLARVTRRLKLASAPDSSFVQLTSAIHDNRSLWNIFSADLAAPANGLPADLRARLLSLALFVERHSSQVLREGGSVDILIEINTAVMRGLRPTETQQ